MLTPEQYAHLTVSTPAHTSVLCGAETLAVASGRVPFAAALQGLLSCGESTLKPFDNSSKQDPPVMARQDFEDSNSIVADLWQMHNLFPMHTVYPSSRRSGVEVSMCGQTHLTSVSCMVFVCREAIK